MAHSTPKYDAQCIASEKRRLKSAIRSCDYCATSYEEHHRCYREAAKESGRRSKTCVFT